MADDWAEPEELPEGRSRWWDMFAHADHDPRTDGGWDNTERAILAGSLSDRRLTLALTCSGIDAKQMARQSVPA